jgi:hypothetical protein
MDLRNRSDGRDLYQAHADRGREIHTAHRQEILHQYVHRGALEGRRYDRRMAVLGQCDVHEANGNRTIARLIPMPEHYLPLLYILGLHRKDEPISFPVQGVDGG